MDSLQRIYDPWYPYRKKSALPDNNIPLNELDTTPKYWLPFNPQEQQRWKREQKILDSLGRDQQKKLDKATQEYNEWAKRKDKRGYEGWRYISFHNYPQYYDQIRNLFSVSRYNDFQTACKLFVKEFANKDLETVRLGCDHLYDDYQKFNFICYAFNEVIEQFHSICNIWGCRWERLDTCLLSECRIFPFADVTFSGLFDTVPGEDRSKFWLERDDWFRTPEKEKVQYLRSLLISPDSDKVKSIPIAETIDNFAAFYPFKRKADSVFLLVRDTLITWCDKWISSYDDSIAIYNNVEYKFRYKQKDLEDTLNRLGQIKDSLILKQKKLQNDFAKLKTNREILDNKASNLKKMKADQQNKRAAINAIQFKCPYEDSLENCSHLEIKRAYYQRLKTARDAYYYVAEKIGTEQSNYYSSLESWEEKRSGYYEQLGEFNNIYGETSRDIQSKQSQLEAVKEVRKELYSHLPEIKAVAWGLKSFRSDLLGYRHGVDVFGKPCSSPKEVNDKYFNQLLCDFTFPSKQY